jgi:hypothetical protein
LKCEVQENGPAGKCAYQTNCGGTHGFSGAGYLTLKACLVAVHRGQEDSLNLDPLEVFSSYATENQKFDKACGRAFKGDCFKDGLNNSIQFDRQGLVNASDECLGQARRLIEVRAEPAH